MPPDEMLQFDTLRKDYVLLPAEAQREVADFAAFLRQRYTKTETKKTTAKTKFSEEPFVGMWRDREDMEDSANYVRELRKRNWTR